MKWLAFIGAAALAAAAIFLLREGLSDISGLGVTARGAIDLTLGGMLIIGIAIGVAALSRRGKRPTLHDPARDYDDGESPRR